MYQHSNWQGELLNLPTGKVVAVGSNYLAASQTKPANPMKDSLLFIKPENSLCDIRQPIVIPTDMGRVFYEIELAVLIGDNLKKASEDAVAKAIVGYGLALDLTLRDLLDSLREKQEPWEKAKAFDGACPISGFIDPAAIEDPANSILDLKINGKLRQRDSTQRMLRSIFPLISYMSEFFTLRPGDIILTGTPEGPGELHQGDKLTLSLNDKYQVETQVF